MSKVTRRDYDAFDWLPLDRWSIDSLMGPSLEFRICCKICDKYVIMKEAQEHINSHIATRKRQLASDRRKAKELRLKRLAETREEKRLLKQQLKD